MTNEQLRMQMLAGVITESQYKAKLQENEEKESLNESMIGGIVGVGAVNQIPPREKADYETAFEHFLGKKYDLNEEILDESEIEPSPEYLAAKEDAEQRYEDGEKIDSIISNYPNLSFDERNILRQDLEGKMDGMDY